METIPIFKNHIIKSKFKLDWSSIKPIAEEQVNISNQHYLEVNGVTSFEQIDPPTHHIKELYDFYEYTKPIYNDFVFNKLKYPKDKELEIQNAWFSKYTEGGYVKEHDHRYSVAVMCLYIELPKNGGNIEFKDPHYLNKKKYITNDDDSWLWNEVEVNESDLLLFDATLLHKSQPNLSNMERWTLTTNIGFKKNIM